MRIFHVLLDEELDRTPEGLNSECDVDASVGVGSLQRGVTPLGPSVTEAARVRSHLRRETETLPENLVLVRCLIERREEDFVETDNKFWRWLISMLPLACDLGKG